MSVKLELKIGIVGKDEATKVFAKASDAAGKLSQKITAAATSYLAFSKAWSSLKSAFEAGIGGALAAEKANGRLATALKVAGKYSEDAKNGLATYAEEMERASGISGELVKEVETQNVAMGLGVEQTEALTQAAIGLAKATGKDLLSANRLIVASFKGEAGELGALEPKLRGLTKAQLQSGLAVDMLGSKYKKFITEDADQTGGALDRIKNSFEDVFKEAGGDVLEGVDLPGRLSEITGIFDEIKKTITDNKTTFVELGNYLANEFVDALRTTADMFKELAPTILGVTKDLISLIKLALIPFAEVVVSIGSVWSFLKGDKEAEAAFDKTMDRLKDKFQDAKADLGFGERATAVNVEPPSEKGKSRNALAASVKDRKFGTKPRDRSAQDMNDERQIRAQLDAELIAAQTEMGNKTVAEHAARVQKISEIERQAAEKGIDVSRETTQLQETLAKNYSKKLGEEYDQQRFDAAKLGTSKVAIARAAYAEEVAALEKARDEQKITDQEYFDALEEARAKSAAAGIEAANEDRRSSTARKVSDKLASSGVADRSPEDLEADAQTAVGFLDAAQGGLNSVISKVASMYGPIGQLVGSIITMLNQSPEAFSKMVDGFIEQLHELPKNLVANIQILFEKIIEDFPSALSQGLEHALDIVPKLVLDLLSSLIEALPKMLGKVFSASFWSDIANKAFVALRDAFKNFFSVLFTGKGMKGYGDEVNKAKRETAKFGSDDPNAGGGEFKIKDADLRNRRRAGAFEDTFKETVEEQGESFGAQLKKAFDDAILGLWDWVNKVAGIVGDWGTLLWKSFLKATEDSWDATLRIGKQIWDAIWSFTKESLEITYKIGKAIWDAIWDFTKVSWEMTKTIGKKIWDAIWDFTKASWDMTKTIGKKIWDAIWDFNKASWEFTKTIGKAIWDEIWNFTEHSWDVTKQIGQKIWDGLSDAIGAAWAGITNMGAAIWNGFITPIGDWFAQAGAKIWNGFLELLKKADFTGIVGKITGGGSGGLLGAIGLNRGGSVGVSNSKPDLASAMLSMGALAFAGGGMVPGAGMRDTVPAVLTPGERVMTREQARMHESGTTINLTLSFNVATGAKFDKDAAKELIPHVIEQLKRETRNGVIAVRKAGIA